MPHFSPNAYFCTMQPSEELKNHIETEIIPRYESFDAAHGTDHVRTVIAQSLDLARHYDVDADMIYAVAAYHDTGLARGRELHHIHSGEILLADTELRRWFTAEQLAVMRDAVEDHRASSDHAPRTIYGRIVAEADRCIDPATVLRRTVQYGLSHCPALDREGHFERCLAHLRKKYAEGGYLRLFRSLDSRIGQRPQTGGTAGADPRRSPSARGLRCGLRPRDRPINRPALRTPAALYI